MQGSRMLVIVVCYYNEHDVVRYVTDEIMRQAFADYTVVIVNNGSTNSKLLEKLCADHGCMLVTPGSNLGYFGGMNEGLQHYLLSQPMPDFVIVSNSDLQLPDKTLFKQIARFNNSGYDVIGPDIRTVDGNYPQNPMY